MTGLLAGGCEREKELPLQGYVEAELTHVSSPLGDRLLDLAVHRGQELDAGALLYALEAKVEEAALEEAKGRLSEARAHLENLTKGRRPSEIREIEARLSAARSALELSRLEFERREKLFASDAVSRSTLDKYRTLYESDQDRVAELRAMLETARLGARPDEIRAAEDAVNARAAQLEKAAWDLEQKTRAAPVACRVFDTYYTEGEWVPAARPVLSLLVPGNVRARFFVPEPELSGWKLGDVVSLSCDGCPPGLEARVSYISPEAEYSPPIIYSQQTRAKLVFLLEARPEGDAAERLHPGQPIGVRRK